MYSGKEMENFDRIIEKARELSQMIENSDIAREYYDGIELMQKNVKAQNLLSKLVSLGRELNESISSGDASLSPGGAEIQLLREEIEKDDLVKNYILAQKNYVNLLKLVQEKIKNPVDEK